MESNLTKILIKKILGKVCIPPPWIPYKEVWPSPFLALTFTLPSEAPGPFPPPSRKTSLPLDPINAVKKPKILNFNINRPKFTFKRVHSTKKITRPYQIKLGLRLTSEEFLKILAPISFQQTSKAFLTLNRSRILLVFCTFWWISSVSFWSGQGRWLIKAADRDVELTTLNNSAYKERHCWLAMLIICGRTS